MLSITQTPPTTTHTHTHSHPSFHFITLFFVVHLSSSHTFISLSTFPRFFPLCSFPLFHANLLFSVFSFSPPSRPSISTAGWAAVSPGWRMSTPPTRRTTTCSRASSWPRRSSKRWTVVGIKLEKPNNIAASPKRHRPSLSIFSQQTLMWQVLWFVCF